MVPAETVLRNVGNTVKESVGSIGIYSMRFTMGEDFKSF